MSPNTLQDKIAHARSLSNRLGSEPFVPYQSVGGLLAKRAADTPDKIFLIWYDANGKRGELSYRQFLKETLLRARRLALSGIQPGDCVATFSGNFPETAALYFACWYLGATVVPLNVKEDEAHLRYILANSSVKLIFTRQELTSRLDEILGRDSKLRNLKRAVEPVEGDIGDYEELAWMMRRVVHGAEALIVYTSGTTGNPKGVVLDHYNLLADAHALVEWHHISADSRMMCVLPIHHVNGTIVTMVTPLVAGSSFVLNERFSAHAFFKRIASESVEVVSVVPTLLAFLIEADVDISQLNLSLLRHIICGAGPLTVDLAMRFERRFGIAIAHGYGLSETTCYSCCLPVDLPDAERQYWLSEHGYPSIGAAFPVNEMAIHNCEGKPLPAGERGEIVIRGHNVMTGYFANEEANRSAFAYGWFRSGDEGFWLEGKGGEPYYFITGRLKELIIRGGVNISPFEIDEVLMAIPGVRAGISVGFDHDMYGEEVGAYIQLDGTREVVEADVIAACAARLPFFKRPKVVLFGDDMPATSTGKYQRNQLKPLFAEWKTARFSDKNTG